MAGIRAKPPFVILEKELLTSRNYYHISSAAKVIYTYAVFETGRQNKPEDRRGFYSTDFKLPYSLIHKYTGFSTPTIFAALQSLVESGFLIKTVLGGLRGTGGVSNSYRLSLEWQKSSPVIKQKRTIRAKKKQGVYIPSPNNITLTATEKEVAILPVGGGISI